MTDAVQIELIHTIGYMIAAVAGTCGVAWISSHGPRRVLEKVAEVHMLVNSAAEAQGKKIDALGAEISALKSAASWKEGFDAGSQSIKPDKAST